MVLLGFESSAAGWLEQKEPLSCLPQDIDFYLKKCCRKNELLYKNWPFKAYLFIIVFSI